MKNQDKPAFIQCEDSNMKKSALDADMNYGLTKREWIATQAMVGILLNSETTMDKDATARFAIEQADELLRALAG